jgi:hypothetical protein
MDSDSDKENDDVPEFPVVTDDVPAQYVDSIRGRPMLVDPYNYVYVRAKEVKGKTYWTCQRERSKLCQRYIFDVFEAYFGLFCALTCRVLRKN